MYHVQIPSNECILLKMFYHMIPHFARTTPTNHASGQYVHRKWTYNICNSPCVHTEKIIIGV